MLELVHMTCCVSMQQLLCVRERRPSALTPFPTPPPPRSGLGNQGQAVTALTFTPPLTACGPLQCTGGCTTSTTKRRAKYKCTTGSPWCPLCGTKGCDGTGKCRK